MVSAQLLWLTWRGRKNQEGIMRLVTYEIEHKSGLGVISKDGRWIYPLTSLDMDYKTMQELIENISDSEKQLLDYASGQDPYKIKGAAPMEEVCLKAPIPYPKQDVICLGVNYMAHAEESARYKKEEFNGERPFAIYFSKRVNRATAPGEGIPSHQDIVKDLDYEAELAVIIGREASHVPASQVKQWYFGKGLDGFLPMGPCIATVDELQYPPHVQIQSRVNGELRQDSNTRLLIFDIDHIVSELSQGMTLKAGTIIATGTPAGVGMGFNPPRFLKRGDVVECTIEGIGTIANKVMD